MRRNWIANIIAALNQDCVVQASNASGAEDDIDLELDAGCREFCAEVDYDDHLATLRVAPEIIDGEKQVDVRVDCPIEEDMVKVCQEALRIEGPELEGLEVDVRISRVADGLCTFTAAYGCAVGAAEFVAAVRRVIMAAGMVLAEMDELWDPFEHIDRTKDGDLSDVLLFDDDPSAPDDTQEGNRDESHA